MKKLIYISLVLLASVSCEKQLKEVVYSNLTDENAFTTAENAQAAVNSLYSSLHLTYREPMFYINDISTDGGYKGDSYFESMNDVAIYNDNRILVAWNGFFEIVTRANIVIDQVPEMADNLFAGGVTKEQLLGEAYFMRAFAYYNLTDVFFQVPLVTSSKIDPTAREPYAPLAKIETVIENDLFNACDYLPRSYASNKDAGRPTYGAAHGYLARLYMRQAGRARQNGEDASGLWKDALNEVNKVLALEGSVYSLQPTVWDVFDPTTEAGIYNNELIFAIRASGNDLPSGSWDLGLQFTGWNYDMGWGNMYQPLEMTWKFDPADQRLTVLQVTEYEDVYSPDETYYRAPSNIAETGAVNKNHTVNGKTYVLMNELAETYTQKYKFLNTWKYIYDTPNNLPLMRLSDMILCKAEILNELNGPTQEAIDLINRVRDRAFQDSAHGLKLANYGTREKLRSAICDERLFELNMECLRRPDLIRMGLWKDRMTKYINTIKQRYAYKAANEGQEAGYYDPAWAAYPDVATLTDDDIRRYMPVPYREVTLNPSLKDARTWEPFTGPDVVDDDPVTPVTPPTPGPKVTRWDFDSIDGWYYYTHNPEQGAPCFSVSGGMLSITTKGNTMDRNKLQSNSRFGEGVYTWRLYVPEIEKQAQVSVGAFIYQNDEHELDFEIGYGKAYARESCGAAEDELVACLTNQQNPHNSTYVPIKPGWHECAIKMDVDSNNYYKATWVIDGETVKTLPLNFGPDKYSNFLVACSVENLTFLGDHMPTRDHTAKFDWVTVETPEQ